MTESIEIPELVVESDARSSATHSSSSITLNDSTTLPIVSTNIKVNETQNGTLTPLQLPRSGLEKEDLAVALSEMRRRSTLKSKTMQAALRDFAQAHSQLRPTSSGSTIVLATNEYKGRVESACNTTYHYALRPAPPIHHRLKPDSQNKRKPGEQVEEPPKHGQHRSTYARNRIMYSNRSHNQVTDGAPVHFSTPVDIKDRVLPKSEIYIRFHQMTARPEDGVSTSSSKDKNQATLGPGHYDTDRRPQSCGAAVKFSPSDRFHDVCSSDQSGPGQYNVSDQLTSPRAVAAIFTQIPRQTQTASIISSASNVVSSYYYVPPSAFGGEGVSSGTIGDRVGASLAWSRTPRFKRDRTRKIHRSAAVNPAKAIDFVAKNMRDVQTKTTTAAGARHARRLRLANESHSFKHRNAIVFDPNDETRLVPRQTTSLQAPISRFLRGNAALIISESDRQALTIHGWLTITTLATFHLKLSHLYTLAGVLQHVIHFKNRTILSSTFKAWRYLDTKRKQQYASWVIARNTFRVRFYLRLKQKAQQASLIRQFLRGLSIDVRFAIAIKRIKRKIQLIQRWWRHMQLMVRAREEALYQKWITVENRLRLEYLNQMPYLHKIYQPSNDVSLHKLIHVPEQKQWYTARFILLTDGVLRGFNEDEMVVETKHFRSHFHSMIEKENDTKQMSYNTISWKPYLMLYRQGTFRFILVSSCSNLSSEIMTWKEKIERLAFPSIMMDHQHGTGSSVGEFVEVAMQSGLITSDRRSSISTSSHSLLAHQTSSLNPTSNSTSPRGKLHQRVRTMRQKTTKGLNLAEGELNYYVVDLLKDFPKVPSHVIWQTIRDKIRDKRKAFRAEIYRYKLELFHYQQHQAQVQHMQVLEKFRDFFKLERPRRPHFRSLISQRKMETLIRQTIEQVKITTPSNPKYLLDVVKSS